MQRGDIAQLIRVLPWHGRSRGFESLYLHQELIMNKKQMNTLWELGGWIGVVLILVSYCLLSLGFIDGDNTLYHILILAGSTLVASISFSKQNYQPFVLNIIFAILAIVALVRLHIA